MKVRTDAIPAALVQALLLVPRRALDVYVVMWIGRKADGRTIMTQDEIAQRVEELVGEAPSVTSVGRAMGDLRQSGHIVRLGETSTASIYGVIDPVAVLKKGVPGVDEPGLLNAVLRPSAKNDGSTNLDGSAIFSRSGEFYITYLPSTNSDGSANVDRSAPSDTSAESEASSSDDPPILADPSRPPHPPAQKFKSSDLLKSKDKTSSPLTPRPAKSGGGGGTEAERWAERTPNDARIVALRAAGMTDPRTIARLAYSNFGEVIDAGIRLASKAKSARGPGLIAALIDNGAAATEAKRLAEKAAKAAKPAQPERVTTARAAVAQHNEDQQERTDAIAILARATDQELAEALGAVLARDRAIRVTLSRANLWPQSKLNEPANPSRDELLAACSHRLVAPDIAREVSAIRTRETRVIPEENST